MFKNLNNIKKLIVGFAFIAVAAIAAWNVSVNSNKYGLSDVSLANVEALARSEADDLAICLRLCNYQEKEVCPVSVPSEGVTLICLNGIAKGR